MKKTILFAAATAFFFVLSSCKRDWVCVCSYGGFSAESEVYTDSTKKDAKSKCSDLETDLKEVESGVSCEIEKK